MYLEEAKNYFSEIDKEWDLEKLFKDLQDANVSQNIEGNLMFQIRFKGFLGSCSYQKIADKLNQKQPNKEVNNNQKLTENTIKQYCNTKIIPYINKLLEKLQIDVIESHKGKGERDKWVQIPVKLKQYRKGNRQEVIDMKEKMERALLQLDYTAQTTKFSNSVEKLNLVGTFAIHGNSKDHGQVWLLNRIFYESNSSEEEDIITIKINFSTYKNDMQKLWNYLANQLNQQNVPNHSTETIINSLVEYWEQSTTRKLWFSFHLDYCEVKEEAGKSLTNFMQNFWCPLVQKITAISNDNDCSSLYLFFVDERGNLEKWKPYFKIADDDEPILSEVNRDRAYYPIDLGQLENWTWPVVRPWVNKYQKYLMTISDYEDVPSMIEDLQSIFDTKNQALSVMREICDCCYQSYDEIIDARRFKL